MTQLDASTRCDATPISGQQDLTAWLESGCKDKADWRIGTEHEKFGFLRDTLAPLPFAGQRSISTILQGLVERFSWTPLYEGSHLVALKKDDASVTLEPGGQFELSGAPLEHIHQTCNEVHSHLAQVKEVAAPLDIGFIGLGHPPNWSRDQMPHVPKGRYAIMRRYMPKVGKLGLDMMHRTATVQVNLDFASESDMVQKFRTALALQPLATALFANSSLRDSKATGFHSFRSHIWTDTDTARTGMLDFVFEDGFGFERYTEYMLDVPMYFLFRNGTYLDATGLSFRDFVAGKLQLAPGQLPNLEDWKDHLSTAFPEVRLKTFLEMRGADSGSWSRICALPAFWVGLLYDSSALAAAWDIGKKWTPAQRSQLRQDAAKEGLQARIGKFTLQDIAQEVLSISHHGLKARAQYDAIGNDETGFLVPLLEMIQTGKTQAQIMLEDFETTFAHDMRQLYAAYVF